MISLLEASINTIKYKNGPHSGYIGPRISPWIRSRNIGDSVFILASDGLMINFPREQASHKILLT